MLQLQVQNTLFSLGLVYVRARIYSFPLRLLEAVICSIPKDLRRDLCSSNNYRGKALCSALCKLIDLIIVDKYGDKLITSDLQFAFKGNIQQLCVPQFLKRLPVTIIVENLMFTNVC